MSESKAAEDYKQFESLRNRFSDTNGSSSPSRPEPRKSSKRRFDPRANAPPLVPLVEEGDQPQHASVSLIALYRNMGGGGAGEGCRTKREGLVLCRTPFPRCILVSVHLQLNNQQNDRIPLQL